MSERESANAPFLLVAQRKPGMGAHAVGFLLIMAAADLGRMFWVGSTEAALIWPPAGVALAFAIAFGPRILPTLSVALLVWAIALRSLEPTLWILPAMALTAGPLLASGVLHWLGEHARARGPIGELLAFWGAGLVVAVGVSSCIGAVNVFLADVFPQYGFAALWAAYWTSEAFGTLVFTPLTVRAIEAVTERHTLAHIGLRRGHIAWTGALVALVAAQVTLAQLGPPDFAEALAYFYFPLLAVCAGLGSVAFTDAMIALVGTGIVTFTLVGTGGMGPPDSNFELIDTVLLVTAVTIMTQLLNAMARTLRDHLAAEREAARRDYLTGLANERALAQQLGEADGDNAVLALLDVPATRRALDLLGLAQADQLERQVAEAVSRRAGEASTIARIGRGLYALLWRRVPHQAAQQALDACYDGLDGQRFQQGEVPISLRPAIGALAVPRGSTTADELLAMVSQTLHHADDTTGRRLAWHAADPHLLTSARADQDRAERIRLALTTPTGFTLLAQPIVALAPDADAAPFHELLLRLPQGDAPLMSPAAFLGAAARHGLMPEIDRWVIDRGLDLSARHGAHVSINLSGASIADPELVGWIDRQRRAYGTRPDHVCFEITETESIQGFEAAARIVGDLRGRGYHIALDDFGTGLASFEYIRQLPLDFVKIDGSFVRAAMTSTTDRAMVEAIRSVAATAGLATIAEFVEDRATRDWLTSIGVDYGQGFGISRPTAVDAALRTAV